MHETNLLELDLNLLVVLEVLLEERSVSRTARRIGRSQSATSHALGRLRAHLGDPLLVRVRGQMQPTPRARELAPALAQALSLLRRTLAVTQPFEAAHSTRTFRLAGPDVVSNAAVRLVAEISSQAPKAHFELVASGRGMVADTVEGQLDAFVAPLGKVKHPQLTGQPLGPMIFAVFGRRGHPAFDHWGAESWSQWPHVMVRTDFGPPGPVSRAAQRAGLHRETTVVLPQFSMVGPVLANTDCLFTGPYAALADDAALYGLEARRPPLELPTVNMGLFTSTRFGHDQGLMWFRDLALQVLQSAFSRTLL